MKDWRELFEDDALVDGWELYLDGKVENLEVYEEDDGKYAEISAVVYDEDPEDDSDDDEPEEAEEFEVYSEIEGDDIIEITCECHESLEGGFCKHMAAMYYEFEDEHGTVWEENKDQEAE